MHRHIARDFVFAPFAHKGDAMKQLWPQGPVYADDPAFKITTDSVLLADFAAGGRQFGRCMDLGCGGGLLSVLLHDRSPEAVYDSVDIRPEAAELCRKNYASNGVTGDVTCLDARKYRSIPRPGAYDLVVCNPPYYYAGKPSPDPDRDAARGGSLSPAQFSGAAAYLLRQGGELCVVHKPESLTDIFAAMRLADIEPKRLRLVCHRAESAPSLVLIAGRRGGRPGLAALPCLILAGPDGAPTQEVREIYHIREKTV